MPAQEHDGPQIVAGVDGSPSSISALRWAIRQARLTGASADAVMAWHFPDLAASGGYRLAPGVIQPGYDFQEAAEETLAEAIGKRVRPSQ